ncbi:MAG TPA: hypothetical protein VND83_04245 [Acidimicrobiales bacterium]|nr:hypothetical protein [Acidimicrobiales bacterium]
MSDTTISTTSNDVDRTYPPIAWMSTLALAAIVSGGILMATYAPRKAPLGVATALAAVGFVLLASAWVSLSRVKVFSWTTFRNVYKWAQLVYVIQAGMIEFAFVRGGTRGASLVIVTAMLVVFATSVPMTMAFTVARYATPD